jgi:hypothetical protein
MAHIERTMAVLQKQITYAIWRCNVCKFKFKLIYDRQSVGQSVLVPGTHMGPVTNFFSLLEISLGICGILNF